MSIKTILQSVFILLVAMTSQASFARDNNIDFNEVFKNQPWHQLNNEQAVNTMVEFARLFVSSLEQQQLKTFDDLDFNVFSNQKWHELGKSHAQDVIVHWPDGRITMGIDAHINDLESMFVYAPDTRIQEHPIRISDGRMTAVVGIMEGTFSEPMVMADGSVIEPTGKSYRIMMATIGRWENGVMAEEWLFWDNLSFMQQIGLAD